MITVQTTRFGPVDISDDRVVTFPKGLLGFPTHTRFCLLEPGDDAAFFWLQSLDEPSLAFVATDPSLFVPDYSAPITPEKFNALGLTRLEDAQVFVIVNKNDGTLTGNLQGPLVVNTILRIGEQIVLADSRWTTRHPLMPAPQRTPHDPQQERGPALMYALRKDGALLTWAGTPLFPRVYGEHQKEVAGLAAAEEGAEVVMVAEREESPRGAERPPMLITSVASWFGSNRTLAQSVGKAIGKVDWCGVGFAGGMSEIPYLESRTVAVNDKHEDVINLAGVIKIRRADLARALAGALVHPRELREAQERLIAAREARRGGGGGLFAAGAGVDPYGGDAVARARDYFVVSWMSRSAVAGTDGELSSNLAVRWDAGGGDTATRFRNACASLEAWEESLSRCWFTTLDVFEFIAQMHGASTRLNEKSAGEGARERRGAYFDPPFPDAGDGYLHKFNESDQRRLARDCLALARTRTRVVMRYHDHPLVREIFPEGDWRWVRQDGRDMHNKATPEVLLVAGEPA